MDQEAMMSGSEDLVSIGTFPSRVDAELAQGALRDAGIDAMVSGDDAGGMRPHLAVAGFRLLVRADDAEQAIALIKPLA